MIDIPFDDIEAARGQVSGEFGPWGESCEVSQVMIDTFAELTSDRQWIHVDPTRAAAGPFGSTIAHGFLVLAMLPAVRPPNTYRLTGWGAVANYGIRALRFLRPVHSGSSIRACSHLLDVEQHRRGTLLTQQVKVQCVGADQPSLLLELQLLYMPC